MRVEFNTFEPYNEPPVPFNEREIGWKREPWDDNLPRRGGFIKDFVFGTRGLEAPTIFCTWTALWCVSAAVRRSAWYAQYPEQMFPNLYVWLVAPPAVLKKSTAVKFGTRVLRGIPRYIPNNTLRKIKQVRMILNKATPEAMIKVLKPLEIHIEGSDEPLDLGSQIAIAATELSTLFGKQAYNMGLVELLTDLYDCPDYWSYMKSGSGDQSNEAIEIQIRRNFTCLIGGSTSDSIGGSISETALGDGFLSRVIPVYGEVATREFADPFKPRGAPDQDELSRRLSWISVHQAGEYHMDEGAKRFWKDWYHGFWEYRNKEMNDKDPRARFDVLLKKLGLLLRLQRYEEGDEIDVEDMEDAKRILEATFKDSPKATNGVGVSQFMKNVQVAERRIRVNGTRTRRQILTSISSWRDSYECTRALQHLSDEGKIQIYDEEGNKKKKASNNGREYYEWIGDMENRFRR